MAFPKDPTSPLAFISKHAYTCTHTHIKSSKKPKRSKDERLFVKSYADEKEIFENKCFQK